MRVLLDTNIALDLLLKREPWFAEAAAIAEASADGRIRSYVSASSVTDIYYISRKLVGAEQARRIVRVCLDTLQVMSVTRDLLVAADQREGIDYEDNLQIECAIAASLDAIVTRDVKGFVGSPLPILTPAALIARLSESIDTGIS